ncbi:MAG: hypothetical protein J6B04_04800 [Clostridia bacterium]|nr:hypothetical protein [Clostridia bacterium]
MKLEINDWYKIYRDIPKISSWIIGILYAIWAIIDPSVFNGSKYGYEEVYGIMQLGSWILPFMIWLAIGTLYAIANYFVLSAIWSVNIIKINHLEEISKKLEKNDQ